MLPKSAGPTATIRATPTARASSPAWRGHSPGSAEARSPAPSEPWPNPRSPAGNSRLLGRGQIDELPFVVMGAAVVNPQGRLFALTCHADNPSRGLLGRREDLGRRPGLCRSTLPAGRRRLSRSALSPRRQSRLLLRLIQELELAIRDDRILVFPAQKVLLDQHVEARRVRIRIFALEQADCAGVLGAAEDELFLLLAPRQLVPDGHRRRPQDGHDAKGNDENGHRIAVFAVASLTP